MSGKLIVHIPPPPPPERTFDLVGLSLDQVEALQAIFERISAYSLFVDLSSQLEKAGVDGREFDMEDERIIRLVRREY